MKTILKILILVIILGLIGYGAYWFFSQKESGATNPFSDGVSVGDFFPFGTGGTTIDTSTPINTTPNQPQNNQNPTTPPDLWAISTDPQSGAVVFNASNTPFVRFVDKATGNILESNLTFVGTKRISNTTIPKVYESTWQKDGKTVILRYLGSDKETIKSVTGNISSNKITQGEESFQELKTSFLPDNIDNLSVEPSSGTLAYLTTNQNGSKVFVSTAKSPKQIFESVIKDFSISWVNKTTIALQSKPSFYANGQLYFLKSDNGLLTRVLSGPAGLSGIANPAATQVLYSESTNSGLKTSLFDIKTGANTELTLRTLAEKCVWSNKTAFIYCAVPKNISNGRYPDDWYQGRVSFDDNIWQIDTLTGTTKLLVDPSSVQANIDGVNLVLDPNERYLVFTNKKDSRLWGLKI